MKISKLVVALSYIGLASTFPTALHAGDDAKDVKTLTLTHSETCVPPPKPLMSALNDIGIGDTLSKNNMAMYGYIEGGYFHDFSVPKNGQGPTYVGFNNNKNNPELNKIDLAFERTVDPTKKQFDIGFHVEGLWGTDASLIHSRGLFDDQTSGRYQWDLIQAYVDVTVPDLPLRIRVGKWIELAGFEQFSANIYGAFGDPSRAFYSYSYQFLYAEPGTQTGALATYVVNDQLSFDVGVTRGWNQSLQSNGTADFLGRVTYSPTKQTSIIFVMTEGPEFPTTVGKGQPEADRGDWWTALDLVVTHKINDKLSIGFGGDYVETPNIPGYEGAQQWGGTAFYASYALNSYLTLNGRGEWYHDDSGFSVGASEGANFYEGTIGVAIKPMPDDALWSNLLVRPEFRYDTADKRVFANGDKEQWTFSVDALFMF